MMNTFEQIKAILADSLKGKELTMDSTFKDVGIDSIDLVEIVFEMEEELGVTFEDEDLMNLKTVADLVALVDSKK